MEEIHTAQEVVMLTLDKAEIIAEIIIQNMIADTIMAVVWDEWIREIIWVTNTLGNLEDVWNFMDMA